MPTGSRRTPLLAAALAALSLLVVAVPATAEQSITVPVVHLEGRGHGHGVGMSQWGAFTMASDGAAAADILAAFYPGTSLGNQGGEVVVVVDERDRVRIQLPGGGEIRSARTGEQQPGFPVTVAPGGTVEIVREPGGYRVVGGSVAPLEASAPVRYSSSDDCILFLCTPDEEAPPETPPAAPPPTSTPPPSTTPPSSAPPAAGGEGAPSGDGTGADPSPPTTAAPPGSLSSSPVWAVPAPGSVVRSVDRGRSYRGQFEVVGEPGRLRLRNHVDIEDYLKGMAEVPGTWPPAAVQAQAIAARTYALRAMAAGGELCDSASCQVYAGTAHETPGQVAAVDATRHVVVTYGGALAATFYSASGGGFSANVAEGFGTATDVPYLQARPYTTVRPDEWSADIALTDVARRMEYPGTISAVRIDETGPSGRPLRMTLDGDAGPVPVDPQDFRRSLGLRSTLFSVVTSQADDPPPPPPEAVDPGVVGSETDLSEDRAVYTPVRRSDRDRAGGEHAAGAAAGEEPFPLVPAVTAFALLVVLWSALSLRAMTSRSPSPITMARWTNRSA